MGTLRKMGAFLGLVPDDQRYGGDSEHEHAEFADDHGDGYRDSRGFDAHGFDAQGRDPRGVDPYDADSYRADGYDGEYAADGSEVSADYRAGYDNDGYRGDDVDHDNGRREPAYAGYQDSTAGDDGYDHRTASFEPEPAYAGGSAQLSPTARHEPAKAARGGSRGGRGSRGRDTEADYHTQGALAVQPQTYQVESPSEASTAKPVTVKLAGFGDARQVGETYRDGQAVILDMTDLTDPEARRMVDFAAGLAFAVHGSIDKVTTKVFMLHQPAGDPAH